MVRPSGLRGAGSTKRGQADAFDEPRARVSSWPPPRPARLRRGRGSVVVVSPTAPTATDGGQPHEAGDRDGRPPHLRGGGGPGGRPVAAARPGRHGPLPPRGLRPHPGRGRRGRGRRHRRRDGGGMGAGPVHGAGDRRQPAPGEGDRARPDRDRQDRRRRAGLAPRRLPARGLGTRRRDGAPTPAGGAPEPGRAPSHTGVKNEIHAVLAAHLVPPCPHAELFNGPGRAWLAKQILPDDERAAIDRHLRELDRLSEDLAVLDREIGVGVVDDPAVRRPLTTAGVNATVAADLVAAIGDVRRFPSPQKLVSYFGLNPRVRQSGLGLAQHGRISKVGRAHARALLVEAAWAAAKAPGPLHAFFVRVRAWRGHQVAAVATARKMAVLVWHLLTKEADYLWARPALVAQKLRGLELQAGRPSKKGNKRGSTYAYNVKELRDREKAIAEQAERAYEHLVASWRPKPGRKRTGAASAAGSTT